MKKYMAIIALLIIVGLILIIIGCSQKETEEIQTPGIQEPEQIVPPELPSPQEQQVQETVIIDEPVVVTESSREEPPNTLLTELRCVDNKIEGVVTNVDDETMDLSDAIVYINGILKRNPECDAMVLNPGNSTFCTNFIGNIKPSNTKGNKFLLRISGYQWEEIISCPE